MSVLNSKDLHIWDNAAFDNGGISETSTGLKCSWSHMNQSSSSVNLSNRSFDSDCSKENLTPCLLDSPKSKPKPKKSCLVLEERNLDLEIEEIEKEISRLSTRLASLRLEKAKTKKNAEALPKRGKLTEPTGLPRCNEEKSSSTRRRGVSLGPAEIMRGMRNLVGKPEMMMMMMTPLQSQSQSQSSSNRRKSCYWKLQDIDELRVTKERGKAMSLSPKSRSKATIISKTQIPSKAATAIGVNRTAKRDDGVMSSIQPKKLFVKDGEKEKSASKKPLKSGRVVPSRYNNSTQITAGGGSSLKELRKRSWPDNEDDTTKRSEKKRASLVGTGTAGRAKKQWDIPDVVPKIKTKRCCMSMTESPRDSGPAKRMSELVGKKSFFSTRMMDNGGENPDDDEVVCQALDFKEDQAAKESLKITVLRSINESPRDSGAVRRVSQLVGRKPFFAPDHDDDMPVFSFEEDEEI